MINYRNIIFRAIKIILNVLIQTEMSLDPEHL